MLRNKLILGLVALSLAGCGSHKPVGGGPLPEERDPLEKINRVTFATNKVFDKVVAYPIAKTYQTVYPSPLRDRVRDGLQNLREPNNFVNALLQAKLADAGKVAARFVINTVFGVFGLFDVAGKTYDIPYHRYDFSSTLGSWGVKKGPYLVLPLKGPSTFRDTIGFVADVAMDPLNIIYYTTNDVNAVQWSRTATEMVDDRERLIEPLKEIENTSLDFYTGVKSAYYQHTGDGNADDYDALDMDSGDEGLTSLADGEPIDPDYQ